MVSQDFKRIDPITGKRSKVNELNKKVVDKYELDDTFNDEEELIEEFDEDDEYVQHMQEEWDEV